MKRRTFHHHTLAALAAPGLMALSASSDALAQAAKPATFVEGQDFRRLDAPAPVPGHGKIDVVEFFWYGCPHCNAFEPALEKWSAKLPADVAFRRIPVVFGALHELHARTYYALEAMGALEKHHRRVFAALHVQRKRLDRPEDITAYMVEGGMDRDRFNEAFNAFGVNAKVRQSKQLAEAYRIDGVPTLGVAGRWLTSGTIAKSNERALQVVDYLIGQTRRQA